MTRSWRNLIDSVDIPVLARGGPSSSNVLNNINQRIQQDIVRLDSSLQDLNRKQSLLSIYLEQQAVGIQALASHLQSLVPAAPAGRGVADFFSTDYIAYDNTAYIDEDFGQATLPVLSVQEKLNYVDTQGNVWVPNDSRLTFLPQDTYTQGSIPSDDQFYNSTEDYLGIGSQTDTFFIGGYLDTEKYLFIKASLPQTLNTSNLSNRITFYPIPAFSHNLVDAYYRKTDGSWNLMEIDYLPGYTTTTSPPQASFLGPTRLHFPPTEVTQVCIVLKTTGWWGVQQFGVQLVEYGSSALLSTDMTSFSPNDINNVIIQGRFPSILSNYNYSITGNKISIALSQTGAYTSPIITGIDARWTV